MEEKIRGALAKIQGPSPSPNLQKRLVSQKNKGVNQGSLIYI
jgi:hypothetical protein